MRRGHGLHAALVAWVACSAGAWAQEDEIVVTASRYRDAYESFSVPHISLVRRADFAVENVTLVSDTRDPTQRRDELRQALQALTRFADRSARISVALIEEDEDDSGEARVVPFTVMEAMESLRPSNRVDTSQVMIAVRTAVDASDDLDAVDERLDQFIADIPRPGRVEVSASGLQLTLNDPRQYRSMLIDEIAGDAGRISATLGAGYGARLEGLENPLAWRRAGDLDLRLFIPYRMVVLPREAE